MAFRFRLQSVLDHRQHLEELAQAEFAAHLKTQRDCEAQIAWMEQEMKSRRRELAEREQAGMPAREFLLANEYVTVLRLVARREKERLPRLKAAAERARDKLVEAARDRMVLETLRNRHHEAYLKEQGRLEQTALDEVAVGAYVRRQRGWS